MKFVKKYMIKIIILILICLLGFYVCFCGISQAKRYEIYKKELAETKIYNILHTETFEGGGKSRILYLKNIARAIEKKHDGVLFMFKQTDPSNIEKELQTNHYDLISFGFGVGKEVISHLKPLELTYNVRDELIESGKFSNNVYALPYIVSGYAQIYHKADFSNMIYGSTLYTNPKQLNLEKPLTEIIGQYEAYKNFIYNKDYALLGTARDVYRVNNLNSLGRTNAMMTALEGYTDLIQYIGICSKDAIIEEFLQNIFCTQNQANLVEYSLFSSLHNKLYSSGIYNDMENAILSSSIPRVF